MKMNYIFMVTTKIFTTILSVYQFCKSKPRNLFSQFPFSFSIPIKKTVIVNYKNRAFSITFFRTLKINKNIS